MTSQVSWTITVPEELDESLRDYLSRQGTKEGDLNRFVEEAVHERLFELMVQEVKQRNRKYPQEEIMDAIDEALANGKRTCPL